MSIRPRVRSLTVGAAALALVVAALPAPTAASNGIFFDGSPGTGDPPPTLGGYPMTPFGPDGYLAGTVTSSVPAPGGGVLGFNMSQFILNSSLAWGWPASYTGHIYDIPGYSASPEVLTLPADTKAFYLYSDTWAAGTWTITATAQDGTTSGPVVVSPNRGVVSAKYFGFYSTSASPIAKITLATNDPSGGNVFTGRFGIYRASPARAPIVNSFSPMNGRVGATVTILGVNFGYANRVTFNGVPAAFSVRGPSWIVATVPVGARTGKIGVSSPFGNSVSVDTFYVMP